MTETLKIEKLRELAEPTVRAWMKLFPGANAHELREAIASYGLMLTQQFSPLARPKIDNRPKIICLCGSTKFIDDFAIKTWELELEGYIVLGCTLLPKWYCPVRDHFAEAQGVKEQRDNHHLQKIDLADEVLVLNLGGYIGESTRNEIAYATKTGKPVKYLEPLPPASPSDAPATMDGCPEASSSAMSSSAKSANRSTS